MKKLTTNQFIEKSSKVHNNYYTYPLTDYKNAHTDVKIICPIHGEFEQRPDHHLNGCGCKKCFNIKLSNLKNSNTLDFIQKSNRIHNNFYTYPLTNYKNAQTNVKIMCPIHGEFEQTPNSHLNGNGCAKCGFDSMWKKRRKKEKSFIQKAIDIHGNSWNYSLVNYIDAHTDIKIICPIHGIFKKSPNNHLSKKQGCPYCIESKGEKEIRDILDKNKIKYVAQKRFKDCKYLKPLPFDFYLPKYNICIEFDGEQHTNENHYFNEKNDFKSQQIRDDIKTEYCKKYNINLIRIKYNENIENKLNFLLEN
jgi:very-short-patch-repair endonuclease